MIQLDNKHLLIHSHVEWEMVKLLNNSNQDYTIRSKKKELSQFVHHKNLESIHSANHFGSNDLKDIQIHLFEERSLPVKYNK